MICIYDKEHFLTYLLAQKYATHNFNIKLI